MVFSFRRMLPSFSSRYVLSVLVRYIFLELYVMTGMKEWVKGIIYEDFESRQGGRRAGRQVGR